MMVLSNNGNDSKEGWGAGVSNSRFYFGSELGWVEKLEENHSLFLASR